MVLNAEMPISIRNSKLKLKVRKADYTTSSIPLSDLSDAYVRVQIPTKIFYSYPHFSSLKRLKICAGPSEYKLCQQLI